MPDLSSRTVLLTRAVLGRRGEILVGVLRAHRAARRLLELFVLAIGGIVVGQTDRGHTIVSIGGVLLNSSEGRLLALGRGCLLRDVVLEHEALGRESETRVD